MSRSPSLNRYNSLNLERAIIIPSLFKHVFPGCRIKITVSYSKGILGRATYKDLANELPLTISPRSRVSKTACEMKYKKFHEVITNMLEKLLPIERTQIRQSDKPWMTPSLKFSIIKRQRMLHKYGKSSVMFKYWRNKVIIDVKSARSKYYSLSVSNLKDSNPSKW